MNSENLSKYESTLQKILGKMKIDDIRMRNDLSTFINKKIGNGGEREQRNNRVFIRNLNFNEKIN